MKRSCICSLVLCLTFLIPTAKATIHFDDGGTHTIDYAIDDYVEITNGTNVSLINGGSVTEYIRVGYDGGTFTMSGGSVDRLAALSSNPMFITGGIIGTRIALDSTSYGGADGELGDVYIYGENFKIDGQSVDFGTYHFFGDLTGTLENGDPLNCSISCAGANDLILAPIPEPATLILFTLGGLTLRKRR